MNEKCKRFTRDSLPCKGAPLSLIDCQSILLEMMKCFHDFCEEHSIVYVLSYGTLLGAVRHSGFIPWDDDIDIMMPRPDYEKFIKFSQISDRYKIVTYKNDNGFYHPFAYAALTDSYTVMVEHGMKYPTGKGQFIDVFPIDAVTNGRWQKRIQFSSLGVLNFIKGLSLIDINSIQKTSIKSFIKIICSKSFEIFDEMRIVEKQDKIAQMYDFDSAIFLSELFCKEDRKKLRLTHDCFNNRLLVPFEKYSFYIPCDYDAILKMSYGNYMQMPPVAERVPHHDFDLYLKDII